MVSSYELVRIDLVVTGQLLNWAGWLHNCGLSRLVKRNLFQKVISGQFGVLRNFLYG
jgi:hypothetical protein